MSPIMQSAVNTNALTRSNRVSQRREEKVGGHLLRGKRWKMNGFLIEFTMVSFPKVSHTDTYTLNTGKHTHTNRGLKLSKSN